MSLRHNDEKPSGNHYIMMNDGVPMAPTPRKKSGHPFEKSFAPYKLAQDPTVLKKSKARPLPSDAEYDPSKHMPQSNAAASTLRSGTTSTPQVTHGDVAWWIHGTGENAMLLHGKVKGLSGVAALMVGHEGEHVVPLGQLHKGFHPDAKRPEKKGAA